MGITPQAIDNTLYQAFGQSIASTMYTALNQYYVVMEVAPQFWQSPAGLKDVYLNPKQGAEVPLGAVAQYQTKTAALSVNHQGQFPSVTVSFNLAPGVALGRWRGACERSPAQAGHAVEHSRHVLWDAAGVSDIALDRTVSDSHGAGGRLYRARNAL